MPKLFVYKISILLEGKNTNLFSQLYQFQVSFPKRNVDVNTIFPDKPFKGMKPLW